MRFPGIDSQHDFRGRGFSSSIVVLKEMQTPKHPARTYAHERNISLNFRPLRLARVFRIENSGPDDCYTGRAWRALCPSLLWFNPGRISPRPATGKTLNATHTRPEFHPDIARIAFSRPGLIDWP